MKNYPKTLPIICGLILLVTHARSQFSYSFDGTTSNHFTYINNNIGELTDSTARNTYFTNGTSTSEDAAGHQYNSVLSLNSDWSISLTITAPSNISGVSSLGSDETVFAGINIEKTGTSEGANFDLELQISNADGVGANDRQFSAEYRDGFSGGADDSNTIGTTLTTVTLRLDYDYTAGAGTGVLTAWYGASQLGGNYDLLSGGSGWNASAATDTVTSKIIMGSANIDEFNTNQPTFDNFSVTAVPEPATAAMLTGLFAIGLAAYRRRSLR